MQLPNIDEQYRSEFPVNADWIYLNHAAVAPLCRPAAQAMKDLADDVLHFGSLHYDRWLEVYEGVRSSAAKLIHADAREIAIVKNTSEGIATVAMGLTWRAGDKIVAFDGEFPANVYPWRRLEAQGVQIEWLSPQSPLEEIDRAAKGAQLLTISFVQYLSGFRADLVGIGEICKRRGCLFFVDAIQGLGAFPLDVQAASIHALAADGHKWLLGPEGCGILYVRQDTQDAIDPAEFGWTNVAKYNDYESPDLQLRTDAGRYECGTLNTIGCFGLRAALDFIQKVGMEHISERVQALGDQLHHGLRRQGYELLLDRTPANASGIVSFRSPSIDSRMIVRSLKDRRVVAAARQGWVRLSPHFYLSEQQIERALSYLAK